MPAILLTTALRPFAPRVHTKCHELNVVSQHPESKNRVMLRVYTHGRRVSMLEVWFDDSDTPEADDRLTTVLNVNSMGTYWNRLHTKDLTFHPCALDTQSFMDCFRSIGDKRPDADVRSDARALADAAAQTFATGELPDSIDAFRKTSTRDQELANTIPVWFDWAVGTLWITVGAIGSIILYRRAKRV